MLDGTEDSCSLAALAEFRATLIRLENELAKAQSDEQWMAVMRAMGQAIGAASSIIKNRRDSGEMG